MKNLIPLWPGKGKVQLRVQLNKLSYIIAADHLLDKKNSSLVIRPPSSHSWLSKRKIDLLEGPFGHILLAIFSFVWLAPSLKIFFSRNVYRQKLRFISFWHKMHFFARCLLSNQLFSFFWISDEELSQNIFESISFKLIFRSS